MVTRKPAARRLKKSKTQSRPSTKKAAPVRKASRPKTASRPAAPLRPKRSDDSTRPLALLAATAALDKKALDPVVLDLRGKSDYADYLLVLSAESERQVDAIARAIEERLRAAGLRRRSIEAAGESNWLLMDFGDLVVHAFYRNARGFYDLEGLWADAPRVPLPPSSAAVS